jgi:FKBP-type peptidyl-prolyl cis-trans isomerase 2
MVQAIKLRRDQLHFQQAQSFRVGDTVQFTGRRGRTEQGTVTRVKIKYVSVDTGTSRWNVPGSHLTKIKSREVA